MSSSNIWLGLGDKIVSFNGKILTLGGSEPGPTPPGPSPLNDRTVRVKFAQGTQPSSGDYDYELVDAVENIWDIRGTKNWDYLLYNNYDVEEILDFNTEGVISMEYAFSECGSLTGVSGTIDLQDCTNISGMFKKCSSLAGALPTFINTDSLEYCDEAFYECNNVESGPLALYQQLSTQTNPPSSHNDTFLGCGSSTSCYTDEIAHIPQSWGGTDDGLPALPTKTVRAFLASGTSPVNTGYCTYTQVDQDRNIWDFTGSDWNDLLSGQVNVTSLYKVDQTGVTSVSGMFYGCTSLEYLGAWIDTSSMTDLSSMFEGCTSLTEVYSLATDSATNVDNMFKGCVNVEYGALDMYNQMSQQMSPPSSHNGTFTDCGSNTMEGQSDLSQIPSSWGGLGM